MRRYTNRDWMWGRRSRHSRKDDSWMMGYILLVGLPVYLIMEHPLIFWIALILIAALVFIAVMLRLKK